MSPAFPRFLLDRQEAPQNALRNESLLAHNVQANPERRVADKRHRDKSGQFTRHDSPSGGIVYPP